jgi:hypothetical protein
MRFLATEATLSKDLDVPIASPLRLSDVDGLGVSFARLQERLEPTFADLPWDEYDAKRERVEFLTSRYPQHEATLSRFLVAYFADDQSLADVRSFVEDLDETDHEAFERVQPSRRRAMVNFVAHKSGRTTSPWTIEREPLAAFTQARDHDDDYRAMQRRFAESRSEVTESPELQALTTRIAMLADEARGGSLREVKLVCHQMGLVARGDAAATNTPEGIHQDGSDYIVSALVIERDGVVGGESVVYGPDKRTEYLRHTLQEGQGIFQADAGSPLWHWATPVHSSDGTDSGTGVRNIVGFDVHVVASD